MKRKHRSYGDAFHIDEVFVRVNGNKHNLWRAVEDDGEVVDVYLQVRRGGAVAKRSFKRLIRSYGSEPRTIVINKQHSYPFAHREETPETIHVTDQYANDRAEHYRNLRVSAFEEWSRTAA